MTARNELFLCQSELLKQKHLLVLLMAMKDMNIAKLSSADLPLFSGIIQDLFPAVETPGFLRLKVAVELELRRSGLQVTPFTVTKVLQLYETKNSRHSSMLVGKAGSGKSVTWRTLQNSLNELHNQSQPGFQLVQVFPLNPKSMSLGELYGENDLSTNEWKDGVLSAGGPSGSLLCSSDLFSDERPHEKWLLFDGPVDTLWIESMNSVMDDNKVLTLINGERISMPEQVSLLFEVENLAVASPATVSRCGIEPEGCNKTSCFSLRYCCFVHAELLKEAQWAVLPTSGKRSGK
uniref:Dynein heavy chain hydrolytic ATP-binding dynein motor region domain-containing protein n=1 Tax=Oryzias latipes TaxID=8090 RepID=A0A3P9JG97_ORYLA